MFKKSVLENKYDNTSDPSMVGRFVFNGYADVRTSPQSPPRNLKQRIKAGRDVINIWFQHFHAERFKGLEEWRDIRVISKASKGKISLPTIDEMTTDEIFEFCKSIDVHPAHLVPLDQDKALSLPTRLLELLVEMAYDGKAAKGLNQNDIYLARAAIGIECKRIRQDLDNDKKVASQNNEHFSTLAQAFTEVLSDPKLARDIAKTTIVTPSRRFASAAASRSYPYIDRVHDMTVIQAESAIEQSNHVLRIKTEIFQHRINAFKLTYIKLFGGDHIEAHDFLDDVFNQHGPLKQPPTLDEVTTVVSELLERHGPSLRMYRMANDEYTEIFGMRHGELEEQDDQFLRELDHAQFGNLVASIQQVFDGECNLTTAEKKHEEHEVQYTLQVEKIREAFDGIRDEYKRNLLNNRVLLSLYNIDVREHVAPQASPK